jgi:hypothetical protein
VSVRSCHAIQHSIRSLPWIGLAEAVNLHSLVALAAGRLNPTLSKENHQAGADRLQSADRLYTPSIAI